jgi:hypothetical protein
MAFSTAACDKVYHARIDVGPFSAEAKGAAPLTAQEREQAVSVFSSVAHRLGLSCRPGEFPIVSGSYDEAQYRLTERMRQGLHAGAARRCEWPCLG